VRSPKVVHETHESLKTMIIDSDRQVIKEWTDDGIWRLLIKQGQLNIFLIHPEKKRFVKIVFPIGFTDKDLQQKLSEVFNDPKNGSKAIYLLRSTINNPCCGFNIAMKDNLLQNFEVSTTIFPFEDDFSIQNLDRAIQNVASTAIAGIDYIKTLLGNIELHQKVIDSFPKTDPGVEFG